MTTAKRIIDARRSRRVRTRLTRVFALAFLGPVMAGSLAYAAGLGPVRRSVDEFLRRTARLLDEAGSSRRDFHLSPNPIGRGVLVVPLDDRGPRPASDSDRGRESPKSKRKKTSSSDDAKGKSEPSQSDSIGSESPDTGSGSDEGPDEAPVHDSSGSGDGPDGSGGNSGEGSGDSDDSGSDSGSSGSDDGDADSGSGESGSDWEG
jgi:hypothetical protein